MTFNGYPNLTSAARSAFEVWLTKAPLARRQQAEDYKAEHTATGKTYKAAGVIEAMVLSGTLPAELQVVADCLKIT